MNDNLFQTSYEGIDEVIRKWGCYWLCLMYKAFEGDCPYPKEVLSMLKDGMVQRKWLDKECTILEANFILDFLGIKAKIFIDPETKSHFINPYKIIPDALFEVQYWESEKGNCHFVLADAEGNIVFDPIEGDVAGLGKTFCHFKNKRVFV